MTMAIAQIGILCTSLPAALLATSTVFRTRRWAYLLGLAGQPFWFWSTVQHGQWGMLALCGCYALIWARGAWNHWLAPEARP